MAEARRQQAEINLADFGPTPAEAKSKGYFKVPQPRKKFGFRSTESKDLFQIFR